MKNLSTKVFLPILSGAVSAVLVSSLILMNADYFLNLDDHSVKSIQDEKDFSDRDFVTEEDLVVDVVEKSSPAVVSIVITKDVPVVEQYYEDFNSPFNDFFGGQGFNFQVPKYRDSGETEEKEIGGGSGFLVSEDGYIVTNKHVVDDVEADYTVFTSDDEKYVAEVIDKDGLNDLAILKIEGKDFPHLEFGDSDGLKPGQSVIAIGNPLLEFNNSVSVGVISGLSRNITAGSGLVGKTEYLEGVIQTDAAINPGNSGGPLLNIEGKVIGVNVAIANGENIGFSIPSNVVEGVVNSVKENGKIVRPFLGVRYVPITEQLKEKNGLTVDYGVLVLRGETVEDLAVIPGSPADKAGIVENDIILEVDGEKLDGKRSLAKIIASKKLGEEIELKLLHRGEEKVVKVVLEENKSED